MVSKKRKGTRKPKRSIQPSRGAHASTTASKSPKEEIGPAPQTETVQLRDLPSISETKESPNTEPSSLYARWLPTLVALGAATVAFGAVLIPRALGVLSLLVAAISVLGLFSPKTPVARRFSPFLGEAAIAAFFRHLLVGLKGWSVGLGVVVTLMIATYIDFMKSLIFLLGPIYLFALWSLVEQLWKGRKTPRRDFTALAALALLTGIIISVGALCEYQISRGSFDNMYATVSQRAVLRDRMMPQARTMAEYADLYRKNYMHSAAANRFVVTLKQYHEDYDLSAMVNWRTERGTYEIGKDTLDRLRDTGISQSTLSRLAPLQGRPFVGASAFERALRERLEVADLASALERLFQFSSRSEQKAREVEMKRTWHEYRQALQDPLVISETEVQVRTTAEATASSAKGYLFPYYLDPPYVFSTLFLVGASPISALAAVLKVSAAWLTWRFLDYGWSAFKAAFLLGSLFGCWCVAKCAKAYNAKYEQPDAVHDNSTSIFFASLTFLSIVIAAFTL